MLYRNRKSNVRLAFCAVLVLFLLAATAGPVMAESAADYGALFDVKGQFNPSALTIDSNQQYLLAYPTVAPPYVVPPGRFRVFIPAGTVKVGLEFYANPNALAGMVARYDMPPQCDYSQISASYWNCYPWDRDATGSLSGLANADMRFRNSGGHGTIIYQPFASPLTQGGWMYIKVLGSNVFHFQYNVWVDAAAYRDWHASGAIPAASGTVSGGCTFEPASGCSPTDPGTGNDNNNNTGGTSLIDLFFGSGSQNNNSGGDSNTAVDDLFGDLFGGLFGGGNTNTGTKARLDVEIDTTVNGSGGVKVVTNADLADYKIVTLNPSLKFDGLPSDEVECFALIVANGAAVFINRETIFTGPAWMVYGGNDRIYKYGIENLDGSTSWKSKAFDFLASFNPGLPPSFFTENRLQFIYAIAPIGEVDMGKFENLRYGVISFRPDEETDSLTGNETSEE